MRLARKQTFGLSVFACLVLINSLFALNEPATANGDDETIILKNATVHTMGSQGTFVGSVVVSDAAITAVGPDVEIPSGATVHDLTGCHIVPGLIESRGKLWLTPAAMTETNTKAELNVVDAIDPWSEDWRELASQGITSVYVQQSSTSSLGGYGSVLRVGPHGSLEEIVLKKNVALQASIGTRGSTSKDRFVQIQALKKLLEGAKEKKAKDSDDKKKDDAKKDDSKESDGKEVAKKADDAKADDSKAKEEKDKPVDPTKIALRRVLSKELPLFVEVHHSDSLKQVVALAKELDIRVVLDGLSQINGGSKQLMESGFPLVAGPIYEPGTVPAYRKNAAFNWLPAISKSGQLWSLSGFSSSSRESRLLRIQAASAIGLGSDHESVLQAITSNSARILGVSELVGSLEVGKQADIAVFTGDPLDPSVPTRLVISNGKVIFENAEATVKVAASKPETNKSDLAIVPALPSRLPARYSIRTTRLLQKGKFVEGTLTIKDGKIVSVGKFKDNAKGKQSPVLDLKDTVVTPGLVMASSSLGQAAAIVDSTESDASHLRSVDSIDPTKKAAKLALAGGFVHIGVSPGTTNTSAGVAGHVRLGAADYVANPAIASQFVLSDSARRSDRFPSSLNGQVQLMNDLFAGLPSQSSVYVTTGIGRMIASEKLANVKFVADRSRVAIIAADSKLEMRSALALVKTHKIRSALLSKGRVGEFAKQLADQGVSLIVSSFDGKEYDAQYAQIMQAQQAGVELAFAGESPEKIRATAALLVNAGLAPELALLALTEGGGQLVGMKDIGLSKGATADFIVWSDSPLNLAAKPLAVVVDGQFVTQK